MKPTLVGRDAEAAAIERFLDRVPVGNAGLTIDGEPGIGKSTLWLEAIRQAKARDYRVLSARPAEREQQLSFAALGDLLRDVVHEIERALPEPQRRALWAALLLGGSEPSIDARTTATGVVTALRRIAAERPVVIAIDDAQWLDRASERALDFAIRRLPEGTGVVLARRDSLGDSTLDLGASMGQGAVGHLHVGALPDSELRRLVAAEAPALSPSGLTRVVAASRGNPFHAIEIARAARDIGIEPGGELPIPESLDVLVRERIARLSPHARAAATAIAASFRPTRATVEAALDRGSEVDGALLEAEDVGVVAWDGDRLRLTHPLLGTALYAALSIGRRRALHRRLGEAAVEPEERAHHLVGSAIGPNTDAARTIEDGADAAQRRGAVDAAAELYLAARDRTPAARVDARARLELSAARAWFAAGDLAAARHLAETAAAASADGHLRARALLLLSSIASYAGTIEERIAAHEAALAQAVGDAALRAEVLSVGAQMTVDPWRALHQAQEAGRLLRAAGETERLGQALINEVMASAVLGLGAPPDAVAELGALEQAAQGRSVDPLVWFHWMDDVDGTRRRFERQADLARKDGDDLAVAELAEFMAMVDFRAGRWEVAERLLEDACRTLDQLDPRGPLTASFADRSVIDAHRGRLDRARATLDGIFEAKPALDNFWAAVCLSALGAVEFAAGDFQAADRAWTAMRHAAVSVGWLDFVEDRSEPDHIEALLALGQPERARQLLTHLEWRGRTIPRLWIDATLPRASALVASVEGKLAAAIAAIDATPQVDALPFERARLLMVKGQLERRANRKLAARRSLEAALAIFEQLGSPPWIDRARDQIDRLGLRHRDRHELTAMERRIAELAAQGFTNRQVADAAFVSPKTVEANLARVYSKLGIGSRAELGARMAGAPGGVDAQT